MPTVVVPANVAARQIEFPEGIERSHKGALYVRPASTMEITDAELAHITKEFPELAKQLIVAAESHTLVHKLTARAATEQNVEIKQAIEEALAKDQNPSEEEKLQQGDVSEQPTAIFDRSTIPPLSGDHFFGGEKPKE